MTITSHPVHTDSPGPGPTRRRPTSTLAVVALVALLAGLLGGGMGVVATRSLGGAQSDQPLPDPPRNHAAGPAESTAVLNVHRVLAKVEPAVVTVRTKLVQAGNSSQPVAEEGTGTGVIVRASGVIVTNDHVVAGAQSIQVQLSDGQTLPASVVGAAVGSDLAVIKVNASGLPTAKFGNSNSLHVGDAVVAIGNALALPGGPTVTEGIVSALGRSIREPNGVELNHLIQTDAAINPGNSGGPLVDARGRVVGINSATATQGQNIGFAIGVTPARQVMRQLESGQSISSPYPGSPATWRRTSAATERSRPSPNKRAGQERGR